MSFLDEIESNVRSKSEVDEENRAGQRRTSINRANAQIEEAKAELLRKAKNADYEILPSGIKKISHTIKFPKFYFSFDVRDLYKEARDRQREIEAKYRPIINAENNVAKRQKLTRSMMDESDKIIVPQSGTFVSKIWIEDSFLYSYDEYIKHLTLLASEESIDLAFEFFNGKKFSGRATDFPVVFNEFVSDSYSPISIIFSCQLSGTDEIKKSRTNAETKHDSIKAEFVITPSEKDNSIILEWEKYPDADGYEIVGYELASKECIDYGTTEELFFEDNNIPEESYRRYYQVAAYQMVNGVRKYLAISNTVYGKRKLVKTSIETESSITEADFDNMEGHDFERFCAKILRDNNFEQVSVTRGSGDQGVDVIAYKEGIKYGIQCKCYSSVIGNKAVQEAYAGKSFYDCHVGAVLTNQFFTPAAKELAKKNHILLWDRNRLIELAKKSAPVKKEILEEKLQIVFFKTSEKIFQMKYGRNILKQQPVAAHRIIPDRNNEINTGSPSVINEPEIKNECLKTHDANGMCVINGVPRNLKPFLEQIIANPNMSDEERHALKMHVYGTCVTISVFGADELIDIMKETGRVPETFTDTHKSAFANNSRPIVNNPVLKCPKCDSTAITTGTRGFSILSGFFGSGAVVNRCGQCGYKWKPKR